MKPIQSVINQVRNNYNNFIMYEEEDWRNNIMKQEEQEYIIQQYINKIIRRLENEERWKREDEEKALRIYLDKLQEEKRNIEFRKQMFDLKYSEAEDFFYNLYTVDHKIGTRNPRIFIVTGHSWIPAKELVRQNTRDINWLPRYFNNPYENIRLIRTQSLGKSSLTVFHKKFVLALKNNINFHRTLVETETDGDAKNLNKIFLQYVLGESIRQIGSSTLDFVQKKFKNDYLTDFRIYPKPKNPNLPQKAPEKIYNFLSNIYEGMIERQFRGVFEITKMNQYGWYEIDDFMVIATLDILFKNQYDSLKDIEDPYEALLHLLSCNFRIPTPETETFIKAQMGKYYLDKLNKMNKINRKLFDDIKWKIEYHRNKNNLHELDNFKDMNSSAREYFNIYPLNIYDSIMDYIDESLEDSNLTAEDEDILIIDGGCNNIDDAKYITGYWNQTLEHPELKKYVAKRSNSAFSNINDPVVSPAP